MEKLAGIILMAGLSTRFESPTNKQLCLLNGKPVFSYSLETFNKRNFDELIVVVNSNNRNDVEKYVKDNHIKAKLVLGGETRQQSVQNALLSLSLESDDIVVIHDAARPLVDVFIINQVIKAAKETGAATSYLEAVNAIAIKNEQEEIVKFVDRKTVAQIQTPQAFKFGLIKEAHQNASNKDATDDCSLVISGGNKVILVKGDKKYHKVTTISDLKYLEGLLK